jgi:transcriptional regulator with XRE-family HTH domain
MDSNEGAAVRSELARAIRNARMAVGLTQVELGARLGLKGRAVYRWERDASAPTKRHRRELVKAIQEVNPQAATTLEAVIGSPRKNVGTSAKTATDTLTPMAQAVIEPVSAFESAIYQAADQLDVPARQLRAALVPVFASLQQANLTFETAGQLLERHLAERPREEASPEVLA